MRITLLTFALLALTSTFLHSQVLEKKSWCMTKCDLAHDEKENTKAVFMQRSSTQKLVGKSNKILKFPLRVVKVSSESAFDPITDLEIESTIKKLNIGFENAKIEFVLDEIISIVSPLSIEDLANDNYGVYNTFSMENDLTNVISVYIFDYDPSLCDITPTSISCGRTGGFSYILSKLTNNVVLSRFDLEDDKVLVHEMGHFFGLYHTFEEGQFGKDNFVEDCNEAGDCICDTPADPGPIFEVYVNYSKCEMLGYKHSNGNIYKPLINNYMSYYKPCYLQEYSFTQGQNEMLMYAAQSSFRINFSN